MKAPLTALFTYDDVVAKLGGVTRVAEITTQKRSAPATWKKKRGKFPCKHYWPIKFALADAGYYAPIHLFTFDTEAENFRGPKQAA